MKLDFDQIKKCIEAIHPKYWDAKEKPKYCDAKDKHDVYFKKINLAVVRDWNTCIHFCDEMKLPVILVSFTWQRPGDHVEQY